MIFDQASVASLLLAVIAGFSTLIGAFLAVLTGKQSNRLISAALGFSAGVMISVVFTDMLPEATEFFEGIYSPHVSTILFVAFLIVGIIAAAVADRLIPHYCVGHDHDHGSEKHHHEHHHEHHEHGLHTEHERKDNMARLGIVAMIATGLHNFPEGIAMFVAGYEDITLGVTLAIAVALHNIPGGITVAMPVYYATGNRLKAICYALVPSVIQPLGALLACLFLKNIMGDFAMGAMFALVGGFLLFIALEELYPNSREYGHKTASTIALFTGIVLMPLVELLH